MRVPTLADIADRRAQTFREAMRGALAEDGLEPYLVMVEQLGDDYDVAQIAAAAIKLAMQASDGAPRAEDGQAAEDGMERLFVRAGRRDGVSAKDFVGAIANEAGLPGRDIGAINVYDNFSFVEVPRALTRQVIDALRRSGVRGRQVAVDVAIPSTGQRQ
jgi:ATP-dependent RNA helicase DeaD